MSLSTITLQTVYDEIITRGDIEPCLNVGGYSLQPFLTVCTDVINEMFAQQFPYKHNEFNVPQFYLNQLQQDYSIPGLVTLSSLERGICIDINSSTIPKAWAYVQTGRAQTAATAATNQAFFRNIQYYASWIPNNLAYFGTWGAANTGNSTWGNNPQANQVITNPLSANTSGPNNPVLQIQDANGNFLVLTGYGTLGSTAPVAPADSAAGTIATPGSGDTTQWTVVDPDGQAIRINPPPGPGTNVWQINLVGQMIAPRFTTMSQTLYPLPDEFEPNFRAGVIAYLYQYSPDAKVRQKAATEMQNWAKNLMLYRKRQDKELDLFYLVPGKTIGGRRRFNGPWRGPANPYMYYGN